MGRRLSLGPKPIVCWNLQCVQCALLTLSYNRQFSIYGILFHLTVHPVEAHDEILFSSYSGESLGFLSDPL